MADTKISNLPELITPAGGDFVPIVDISGIYTTKKITYTNLLASYLSLSGGTLSGALNVGTVVPLVLNGQNSNFSLATVADPTKGLVVGMLDSSIVRKGAGFFAYGNAYAAGPLNAGNFEITVDATGVNATPAFTVFGYDGSYNLFINAVWDSVNQQGRVNINGATDTLGTILNVNGNVTSTNFISTTTTSGLSPYACSSTVINTNLNADLLDGYHASYFLSDAPSDGSTYGRKNASWVVAGGASYSVSNKSNTYAVQTSDLGSSTTFTMTGAYAFNLPVLSSSDLGKPITFVKVGADQVTIQANTGQYIADSASSGTIYDNQSTETYATITLMAITTTQWVIIGFDGTWSTT